VGRNYWRIEEEDEGFWLDLVGEASPGPICKGDAGAQIGLVLDRAATVASERGDIRCGLQFFSVPTLNPRTDVATCKNHPCTPQIAGESDPA